MLKRNNIARLIGILFLINNAEAVAATIAHQEMVVTEQHLASQVGENILKQGGNAIDAAVAVGYALAVVQPCCGNIGGGGFMTAHLANGKTIFLNFREKAPLAAKADMYLDANKNVIPDASLKGYLAVGVPGTVLGLETALKDYGTMSRQQVIAPAIKLAADGYILSDDDVKALSRATADFKAQPNVAAIFLKNDQPYQVGDRLVQKDLANTLTLIAQNGSSVFYNGAIAKTVVQASKKNGGILSLQDFAKYKVEDNKPVVCTYRGYKIISAPPPSSGGVTLCEILNILEHYPLKKLGYHTSQSIHYTVEAMRAAFRDRNKDLGDPDFVRNPVEKLTSKNYATKLVIKIPVYRALPSEKISTPIGHQSTQTTHYSIVDKWGNAVAVTYTLDSYFGAKVIAGDTGFFLNNEMDDFTPKPGGVNQFGLVQSASNAIAPGKRPLSSMTPTIVMKNNKVVMVIGSPGGPRIITSVLQVILNVLDYGMSLQDAVDAPRFHHQWQPDVIDIEPNTFSAATTQQLLAMGYHLKQRDPWSVVEAIYIDPRTHVITGVNDDRRPDGAAIGR